MRRTAIAVGSAVIALVIAACSPAGSGGSTDAPPVSTPDAATPAAATPAATVTAGACGDGSGAPGPIVRIFDLAFEPPTVQAKVGEPVGWSNKDGAAHTATMDSGDCATRTLDAGRGDDTLVFNEPGEFAYHCSIHPSMKGTVVVTN
ncbi:MAG TPA: plastocyanin/azurin family copper-binding protein [Thermoleophilia bacterium]|nr:plastocyanin/azurin family copper-binding protein [Thermoleophilia bacterium]